MKITISRIPAEGLSQQFSATAAAFPVLAELIGQEGYVFKDPIQADITATVLSRDLVEIRGRVTTTLAFECGRCLTPFDYTIKRKFKLGFVKSSGMDYPEEDEGQDIEIREEDIATDYYTGDVIDLKNAIQEQVVMCLPQHPLCREDCQGLCQSCGANLNTEPCACEKVVGHPAFAVLKGLKH